MKETLNLWVSQNARLSTVMAVCVFYPDKTRFSQSWSEQYPAGTLENAWRCLEDTFQVLHMNRLPFKWTRWVFAHGLLHCVRRADGVSLAIFSTKDQSQEEASALERLLEDFVAM